MCVDKLHNNFPFVMDWLYATHSNFGFALDFLFPLEHFLSILLLADLMPSTSVHLSIAFVMPCGRVTSRFGFQKF